MPLIFVASRPASYRPEIDGLRALAVLSVIINHINKSILPSGYLGVDLFFVISGYVISSSLASSDKTNFIAFIGSFYQRRTKRLLPSLIFYVSLNSIFISLFNPWPGLSLLTGLASLVGLSNIFLLQRSTDYFSQTSELNPFTHTWSLGVEEQFYLIFPFLIWFSGFSKKSLNSYRILSILLGILSIASFLSYIYLYKTNQPASFFLMSARFWEFAAGSLAFMLAAKRKYIIEILSRLPSIYLVISILLIQMLPQSYGLIATPSIVLFSALLICTIKKNDFAYQLLTSRVLVEIGLISYSLYLWHWSVLSISRSTIGIYAWSLPIQILLMIALALFSHKYVEIPFRYSTLFGNGRTSFLSCISLLIIPLSIIGCISKPLKNYIFLGNRPDSNLNLSSCSKNDSNNFVVGDSHAQEFSKVAYLSLNGNCKSISDTRLTGNSFLFNHNVIGFNGSRAVRDVRLISPDAFIREFSNLGPEKIIISVYWLAFFSPQSNALPSYDWIVTTYKSTSGSIQDWKHSLDSYIFNIGRVANSMSPKTSIIIVLPEPEFNWVNQGGVSDGECELNQWFAFSKPLPQYQVVCKAYSKVGKISKSRMKNRSMHIRKKLELLARQHKNIFLYDPLPILCPTDICKTHDEAGKRIYRDDDHINDQGAKLLSSDFKDFLDTVSN